ncbi:unnamed protein product [Amoebophrya sp. A25]|nr:unnamed protein product [Amoebophrya sp. A25]|eukprot:GSA25T00021033001.1
MKLLQPLKIFVIVTLNNKFQHAADPDANRLSSRKEQQTNGKYKIKTDKKIRREKGTFFSNFSLLDTAKTMMMTQIIITSRVVLVFVVSRGRAA